MPKQQETKFLDAVDEFNAQHDAWANASDRPLIDPPYSKALKSMFDLFESANIPPELRELENAVLKLRIAWNHFDESGERMPDDSCWAAREDLERIRERVTSDPYTHLEPIEELHRQGVGHGQIAQMYTLDEAHLVQQELDRPGSVIGKDWIHPGRVERQQQLDAECSRLRDELALSQSKPDMTAAPEPCPEASYELFLQDVPIAQAAKMLCCPIGDVESEWNEFERERQKLKRERKIAELQAELAETN